MGWVLNACPHCHGSLYRTPGSAVYECMLCGREWSVAALVAKKTEVAA